MIQPLLAATTCTKRLFQLAVKSLNDSVALRMIGGGGSVLYPQRGTEAPPRGAGKLGTPVCCQSRWHAESADPGFQESVRTLLGRNRCEGTYFWPACCPVYDGQQVGVATF